MADLLIELGCEDLPARFVQPLATALADGVAAGLAKRGVAHGAVHGFATPRRIAVQIDGVAARQPDQVQERFGPALAAALKDDQPTPAALGFAKSCGVPFAELGRKDGKLHYVRSAPGQPTAALLPAVFDETVAGMDALVPKRMRWGGGDDTFVRPVQWLVALLDDQVVPLTRFGLTAGNLTYGHRFHAPAAIALTRAADYEPRLRAAKVWAEFAARREEIRRQVEAEAARLGGKARITDELLDEVTALVELPVVISGRLEARFLELPPEVIIATIEQNQRYFPVFSDKGPLLPQFITVSNVASKDVAQVIAGNERVVRPRLTDAMFFWQQDRKRPLADYLPALDKVTFQKDLGSVGDKARRIAALTATIGTALGAPDAASVRAAQLCKADLVSRMVYEFPELQGLMGGYYARAGGEPDTVATAIAEHYRPTQSGTPIPQTRAGQTIALADKLDTLAGIFAIGQKPTASKDPYALRRAALGALRICIEGGLRLDLKALLAAALAQQPVKARSGAALDELWTFVLERLRARLEEQGVAPEVFNAVAATSATSPVDFAARIAAVQDFLAMKESTQLAAAHKRIRNILKQAGEGDGEVRAERFRESQERQLFEAMTQLDGQVQSAAAQTDYTGGLRTLARLQAPVDAFFDKVMVMAPEQELRANRVALLRNVDRLCRSIADISCLPG